jgi:hypothetical protein
MEEYEREFDPSRYRTPGDTLRTEPGPGANRGTVVDTPVFIRRVERVMGYRVQVYSTTDADDAARRAGSVRGALPELDVDVVFHAPFHKVRVGNFLERGDAEQCRALLQSNGFPEAWIVRDLVDHDVRERIRNAPR